MDAGVDVYSHESVFDSQSLTGHRKSVISDPGTFTIGKEWLVLPFPIEHDVEGFGYLIKHKLSDVKMLFLTDSFYCKYNFNALNTIMIECNYIKATLDRNIAKGFIPEEAKSRLLKSHFSLENVLNFLRATDLSACTNIVLLHLSANNADAEKMKQAVHKLTGIMPVVADSGVDVEMNVFPY